MLISAADERDLLAELHSQFSAKLSVNLDDADDFLLYEQWNIEHPGTPIGDRRLSTLSADIGYADAQIIAETAVDIICPTARREDSFIRAGKSVTVAIDSIPWFSHMPLWED